MNKLLFTCEESYKAWASGYNRSTGYLCDAEKNPPEQYPCVCTYHEYDISNSMAYGWGIEYEYVYLSDFDE